MTRARRPCLVCGTPSTGSRCPDHTLPARGRQHRRVRAHVLLEETRCHLCGKPGRADDPLTYDHVIPRSHGGPTIRANGRAAHASCNGRRGANPLRGEGGIELFEPGYPRSQLAICTDRENLQGVRVAGASETG